MQDLWLLRLVLSCHSDSNDPPEPNLSITHVSPDHAAAYAQLSITGTGFSDDITKDTVRINGVRLAIQFASPTSLTVMVPPRVGSGAISVTVGTKTATTPVSWFTYDKSFYVSTFAGGLSGNQDGTGIHAQFKNPFGIYCDPSSSGSLYLSDYQNSNIRRITLDSVVSTYAGAGEGYLDGPRLTSKFKHPYGICKDNGGNMFITDGANNMIRMIATDGTVSTFAGSTTAGAADGTGTGASFNSPTGICADAQNNLYVADYNNNSIRKITATGVVTTFAGSTTSVSGNTDGTGTDARFNKPYGICIDGQGNLYVTDYSNHRIRKITPAGVVTTLAGNTPGFKDGNGTSAQFNGPAGICIDGQGNLYVSDYNNSGIRKITQLGQVTTIAGGNQGYGDGFTLDAKFSGPNGICRDAQGNFYVADFLNSRVRKISLE